MSRSSIGEQKCQCGAVMLGQNDIKSTELKAKAACKPHCKYQGTRAAWANALWERVGGEGLASRYHSLVSVSSHMAGCKPIPSSCLVSRSLDAASDEEQQRRAEAAHEADGHTPR